MITWQLRSLMDETTWRTGSRCTYDHIHTATGIGASTLSRIARGKSDRISYDVLDGLLDYFSEQLGRELETQDLLAYTRNKE
jgi:transcriptional regulator with XRE-family HTH domain